MPEVAVVKRYAEGVLSPAARVKPQVGPLVAVPSRADVVVVPDAAKAPSPLPDSDAKRRGQVQQAFLQKLPNLVVDYGEYRTAWDLVATPEVGLDQTPIAKVDKSAAIVSTNTIQGEAKQRLAEFAKKIQECNGKEPDGFIRTLRDERADLAGMPFLLGKSCQLATEKASALAGASLAIRRAMDADARRRTQAITNKSPVSMSGSYSQQATIASVDAIHFTSLSQESGADAIAFVPALTQILAPEQPNQRQALIAFYREKKGPEVSAALARLALYDPEQRVRDEAVTALRNRPAAEYTDILLDGLRYPWAPVAWRAADAVAKLERNDLTGKLIDKLDEPDPSAPFEQEQKGKVVPVVRELVRVNHHRNCLLCHALHADTKRLPRGSVPMAKVPSPAEELPPSNGVGYYSTRPGDIVVRADVTYLRQDFSVMMPVENAAPWPEMQRFDFMIRTRILTDAEMQVFRAKQLASATPLSSSHQQAVLSALRRLTHRDVGSSAVAWRQAVSANVPASSK
jgi:hypothetical protein